MAAEEGDPAGGRFRPSGHECRACYDTRRRYYANTKEQMMEQMATDPEKKAMFLSQRRKRVRGEDRYERRKVSAVKHSTQKEKD